MLMGKKNKNRPRAKSGAADTLITQHTKITGDIEFTGVLHLDAEITGNVHAPDGSNSLLSIHKNGRIKGKVRVPHILILGEVTGDVHASEHIELKESARIVGNVYYNLIEMEMGAEVNGKLVHEESDTRLALDHKPDHKPESESEYEDPVKQDSIKRIG